jgi:hypothetical protein
MNNYIVINNQRIELTEEQVKQIVAAQNPVNPAIRLSEIAVGDTFKIGEQEFIVLEQSGDTTAIICKELLPDTVFGDTNRYTDSNVDEACNAFADEIEAIVGEESIVQHTVDLTSNDGLKDYGTIKRRASSLTADRYRRYVEILDNFMPDGWWWLATPFSTKKHDSDSFVLCVAPSGFIYYGLYYYDRGVRPFLILKSNIFVSK